MTNNSNAVQDEVQELQHAAWPHFRGAFFVALGLSAVYLSIVFFHGGGHVGVGH